MHTTTLPNFGSEIATLLFLDRQRIRHPSAGRVIRFDETEPDPRFTSGPLQKRLLCYLREYRRPATVSQLATAVGSRAERIRTSLRHLLERGKIVAHTIDSDTTEYALQALDGMN